MESPFTTRVRSVVIRQPRLVAAAAAADLAVLRDVAIAAPIDAALRPIAALRPRVTRAEPLATDAISVEVAVF